MPKGPSPYLPLLQRTINNTAARGGFLYVMEGQLGDSWCVWAPPEVAARLPEFLDAAAEEMVAREADAHDKAPTVLRPMEDGEQYQDLVEWMCKRTEATLVFLYVVEGRFGTGWSVFGAPSFTVTQLSELLHGFANDLRPEEKKIREDAGLAVMPIG